MVSERERPGNVRRLKNGIESITRFSGVPIVREFETGAHPAANSPSILWKLIPVDIQSHSGYIFPLWIGVFS